MAPFGGYRRTVGGVAAENPAADPLHRLDLEPPSLHTLWSADDQAVAFESQGALPLEDGGFPVDVFVYEVIVVNA